MRYREIFNNFYNLQTLELKLIMNNCTNMEYEII